MVLFFAKIVKNERSAKYILLLSSYALDFPKWCEKTLRQLYRTHKNAKRSVQQSVLP